jgi:hypothetical protein
MPPRYAFRLEDLRVFSTGAGQLPCLFAQSRNPKRRRDTRILSRTSSFTWLRAIPRFIDGDPPGIVRNIIAGTTGDLLYGRAR